jgi:nucleotide-binding universal stress UspA family protein
MAVRTIKRKPVARRASRRAGSETAARESLQIRSVLVPIDFSQPSLDTIEFALPLLKFFGAQLHLVHVVPPDYPLASLAGLALVVPELEIGRHVRSHLKDAAKKYSVTLRRENIHVLKGRPFQQISQLARDLNTDLIITSTRGATGFKHLLLGSTAERIVRYSPCPVLVARPQSRKLGNGRLPGRRLGFAKILVPIDFSQSSARGLAFAINLATRLKSKLVLMHSVHLQYYVASDEYARYDFPALMNYAEKAARQEMRDLVRSTDWKGVGVETALEVGHPGQQICARAEDLGINLIVTSTHGKTGFKHVLIGSTAEYVVQHAHCSVLVVPTRQQPPLAATATQL